MKQILITIAAVVLVGCGEGSRHLNLYEAAESGDIEAVKQHLTDGTDIELKCTDCGSTALGHAAKKGHKKIAELLVENGADVSVKNEKGSTPLHKAASGGHKEIVELLIAKGADVNAKLKNGLNPLQCAATKEIAELLIAEGADVNAKNRGGKTPLDFTIRSSEIANLLRKHGGKTGEELKVK